MPIPNPSDDVIVDDVQDDSVTSDDVIVEPDDSDGQGVQETENDDTDNQEEPEQKSKDDYYKNRSFELERKLNNLTEELPKIIKDTVIESSSQNQQKREYTIAELEAYALENPEHRPWVEEEKEKIRDKRLEERLKQKELDQANVVKRQQSESRVLSDPKYAEAFVDQNGTKVFNPSSPLAHAMHSYLNDPRIKGQPDALEIAAKLARADILDKSSSQEKVKVNDLKRKNAKLKQNILVEGGTNNDTQPVKSSYDLAADRLRQTGSRRDAEAAVKEYFKKLRG